MLAVALAITGVVLFQYANGFSAVTLVGSLLSVGAAIGAALYKVWVLQRDGHVTCRQMDRWA